MIKRFFTQAWLCYKGRKAAFSFQEFICFDACYPLLTLIFYCLLASYSFNTKNLTHWVVGNSFLLCINMCVFYLGYTFSAERYNGRIRSIITAPINKLLVVLENGFIPTLVSYIVVFVGFIAGSLIFKVPLSSLNLGLFMVVIAVSMFSSAGFGLTLSTLGLVTDSMHLVLNVTSYVLMIFSGANFPISQLTKAAQPICRAIPLTHGIEAANLLFEGAGFSGISGLLLAEFTIGIAYYIIAVLVIKLVERLAIKKASLETF